MDCENEELLHALLHVWTLLDRVDLFEDLTRNETLVCYVLYYNKMFRGVQTMTPTQIARAAHVPKTQINRTLNVLEKRGLLEREQSSEDRRMVDVSLCLENLQPFLAQYRLIVSLAGGLASKLGPEKSQQLHDLLEEVCDIATSDLAEYYRCRKAVES